MKYSNLVTRQKKYKYSANICFDMKNDEKLSGFIPNQTTTEILAEYLYGIVENGLLKMMLFILIDCQVFTGINTMNWEKN